MSCDLIIIDGDTFIRLRPNPPVILDNDKVRSILSLDCFNENSERMLQATFQQRPHPARVNQNSKYFRGGGANPIIAKPPRFRNDLTAHDKLMREVQSNINKIAEANQDTIYKKIEKVVDERNVEEIVNIILTSCSRNGSFLKILMSLVSALAGKYPKEVSECIQTYVANFHREMESIVESLRVLDYEDYNEFCSFLKCKNETINKLQITLIFLKSYQDIMSPDVFFEKLMNIVPNVSNHIQDAVIQMILLFFEMSEINEGIYNAFVERCFDLKEQVSKKSKFVIEDILKKYGPKIKPLPSVGKYIPPKHHKRR